MVPLSLSRVTGESSEYCEACEGHRGVSQAERVIERDQELALHYRFNASRTNATFSVKNYLAVLIPRHDYKKVTFFENGKQVGELNSAEGQWSVPAMTPEQGKPDMGGGK